MAYLIAAANGNWTAAATWGAVDATSLLDSEANTVLSTTAYVESAAFAPGAITVDGIAVKISARSIVAPGTFSVRLAVAGVLVAGTEVTVNVSDIQTVSTTAGIVGWWFMKFAAPVLLVAATNYTVSQKSSTNSTVTFFRNATGGNISRMLRTTTTAAPAAGDSMFILGEWTAAATKTTRVVTMNETATTDYGGGSTSLASLGISHGGTLAYANAAATNYVLRLSGILELWSGATLTIGTAASPIPRDSTAILEFDCGADGDFGIRAWGFGVVMETAGLSRTINKNVVQCLLNTDEAIGQTVLGVDTDTGWLNGDEIAIASTTQTATQAETGTLSGGAGASSITIGVAITAAHGGSAATLVQAEVILLTRNVQIRSVSSSFMAYMTYDGGSSITANTSTFTFAWTDFRYLGSAAAAQKGAVLYMTQAWPTTVMATFCNFRDGEQNAIHYASSVNTIDSTLTMTDCTFYRIGYASSSQCVQITGNANASVPSVLTRCTYIADDNTSSSSGFFTTADPTSPVTIDGCRISSGIGRAINFSAGPGLPSITKRIVNCNIHSMGTAGTLSSIAFGSNGGTLGVLIDNCVIWRTAHSGSSSGAIGFSASAFDVVISNCTFFGNSNAHLCIGGQAMVVATVRNCIFAGDSTFGTPRAWDTTQSTSTQIWRFENCTFGVATGIRVAHSSAAIGSASGANNPTSLYQFTMVNCNIADATEFETTWQTSCGGRSFFVKHRRDQVTATHEKIYPRLGTVAFETTTVRTVGRPSEKMTPTVGTNGFVRLRGSSKRIPVDSGKAVTVSVYVRKDGSYNGNQPRLVMLANPALGLDADLVLDTMTGAASQWEQLTGTQTPVAEEDGVVEVVVEVDGTAGNAFAADWSASSA